MKYDVLERVTPNRCVEVSQDDFYFIYHQLSDKSHLGFYTYISQESYIDIELLKQETDEFITAAKRKERLTVYCNPNAYVITPYDVMLDRAFEELSIGKDKKGMTTALLIGSQIRITVGELVCISTTEKIQEYFLSIRSFYEQLLIEQTGGKEIISFWISQLQNKELIMYFSEEIATFLRLHLKVAEESEMTCL